MSEYQYEELSPDKIKSIDSLIEEQRDYYPDFNYWIRRVIVGVRNGERKIIVAKDNDLIVGVIILKRMKNENKISTIFVDKEYRGKGIGTELIKRSKDFFDEDVVPIITIPEHSVESFSFWIDSGKFVLNKKIHNMYKMGHVELFYNVIFNKF